MSWKKLSYAKKGILIVVVIGFLVFLSSWISGAKDHLNKEMMMDYKSSLYCKACEQEGKPLIQCAIESCSIRSHSDCSEVYNISNFDKEEEIDVTSRHCGYKTPKYTRDGTIFVDEPKYKNKPTFLRAFFSLRAIEIGLENFIPHIE